ncbi:hypothetical protein V2J09_009652 [Rumex salicifolius]
MNFLVWNCRGARNIEFRGMLHTTRLIFLVSLRLRFLETMPNKLVIGSISLINSMLRRRVLREESGFYGMKIKLIFKFSILMTTSFMLL